MIQEIKNLLKTNNKISSLDGRIGLTLVNYDLNTGGLFKKSDQYFRVNTDLSIHEEDVDGNVIVPEQKTWKDVWEIIDDILRNVTIKYVDDLICDLEDDYNIYNVDNVDEDCRQDDDSYYVLHFKDYDKYIRVNGYYSSYGGFELSDWKEVMPVEKTIIVYE